ncbi:MAG: nitronate monooxygenase [Mycobacterium sp.]|nr:nitronate monooxygenase [Mycobacterium sp.]
MTVLDLRDLAVPIVGAPMAGGPTTPALAAAVTNAGGLGFLAAGYLSAAKLADTIAAARAMTGGPLGVNLFVPQPCTASTEELAAYRHALAPLARQFGVEAGAPHADDDDWQAKLEVVDDTAPEVVSFTFGCPSAQVLDRLRARGVLTMVTVTSRAEADYAVAAGAGTLVVQGPEAGGHRSVFAPDERPGEEPLGELLVQAARLPVPVVAAGGVGDAAAVRGVLSRGAMAAQVGTALLLCDEAGTSAVHRRALSDPQFTQTVVTACFTGRYARSLANGFSARYDTLAPLGYPQVHQITGPIRTAALAAGDPDATSLWAGTAWRGVRAGGAADVVAALSGE